MPMTPFMSQIANLLETQLLPGLTEFVEREYKSRSGDQIPSALRTRELVDACLNRMRLKIEESYDLKLHPNDVKSHALLAIRLALYDELDKEFPKLILA